MFWKRYQAASAARRAWIRCVFLLAFVFSGFCMMLALTSPPDLVRIKIVTQWAAAVSPFVAVLLVRSFLLPRVADRSA